MKVKSILVLSALLIVSSFGLVSATYAQNTVTPGAYFSTAPLVEPGIYSTVLGTNGSNGTAYYKFNALKGQIIKVSAVFTKNRSNYVYGNGEYGIPRCTCLEPKIAAYDKNMFNVGQTQGLEYYTDKAGPYCIRGSDTSPNTYSGYYKVTESGVNYVSISTSWAGVCKADQYMLGSDKMALDQEADKPGIETYVDLNVVIEGTPDADAGTVPAITTAPVVTTPAPVSTISGNGSMTVCQFIDLLTLLGVVDSAKAASVKVTMACK